MHILTSHIFIRHIAYSLIVSPCLVPSHMMQLRKTRRHYRKEWSTELTSIVKIEAMRYQIEGQEEDDTVGLYFSYKVPFCMH